MAAYTYSSSVLNSSTSTASQIDASLEQTSGWVSYIAPSISIFNINAIKDLEIKLPSRQLDIWDLLGVFEDLT